MTRVRPLTTARTIVAISLAATIVSAQPLARLKGRVLTPIGTPLAANVRVEALFGFLGGDFAGQRTLAAASDAKGDWALLGFKSGIWMFDASAPGRLPDAIALPFNVSVAPASGVAGDVPTWHPVLRLAPVPDTPSGAVLAEAADAAFAGRRQAVAAALVRMAETSDADLLVAAGRICLVLRDSAAARPFFRRALERNPQSFGAALGMASTALMQRDIDAAGRAFGEARDRTTDKDERSYLTAAIADLNKVHVRFRDTGDRHHR